MYLNKRLNFMLTFKNNYGVISYVLKFKTLIEISKQY